MDNSNKPVVVIRIVGGLGNQMFQYACGRAATLRNGGRLILDTSAFNKYKLHRLGLDEFRISSLSNSKETQIPSIFHGVTNWILFKSRWLMALKGITYIKEGTNLSFQSRVFEKNKKMYLDGYWQNENYFADVADIIRAEFQLKEISISTRTFIEKTKGKLPLVSLHIRRGDYLQNPDANFVHGVLDIKYYQEAVKLISNRIGNNFRLIVFSDDIDWAKQNLYFDQQIIFVSGNLESPQQDLYAMSVCDHHIIANSTFSWWGAWLNPSTSKIVVAPKRWFVSPELFRQNICPLSWELI